MTFVSFLLPAFIVTCFLVGGVASIIKGSFILIEAYNWEDKVKGFVMIIIPITLLIASFEWSKNIENNQHQQVTIQVNR